MSFFTILMVSKAVQGGSKGQPKCGTFKTKAGADRADMGVVEDVARLIMMPYSVFSVAMGWEDWIDVVPCVRRK